MSLISVESFRGFDLRFDELNQRLHAVKKELGMRRAISTRSLSGETRTFAEILDSEVEMIVLFYLEVQGILAKQLRVLRERQIRELQDFGVTLETIEELCQKYRDISSEVLELLNYLDRNSVALRKILLRHDMLFDQKMGSVYFDSRLTRAGPSDNKGSQLRQLYRQEGIRAIVATIRRGFEDLYDARRTLLDTSEDGFHIPFGREPFVQKSSTGGNNVFCDISDERRTVPRVSFRKRLASHSNLRNLLNHSKSISTNYVPPDSGIASKNNRSTGSLLQLESQQQRMSSSSSSSLKRSLSDLEPILKRIDEIGHRVMKTQERTTLEFLTVRSSMALEFTIRDMNRQGASSSSDDNNLIEDVKTSPLGLYLNLFVTFIYLANQYIVAPTSSQYANKLGMSSSMSGIIIGLTPSAALLSSLLYSKWSNYSFKQPLLLCIACACVGNLFYGLALTFQSVPMIFAGRMLTGFGGPRVIARRYIADHVSLEDRLLASGQFVSAGALGFAFGPLLSSLIARLDISFTWMGIIQYENVTAPGWLMLIMWMISLVGVVFFFEDPVIITTPNDTTNSSKSKNNSNNNSFNNNSNNNSNDQLRRLSSLSQSPSTPSSMMMIQQSILKPNIVAVETGSELWTNDDNGIELGVASIEVDGGNEDSSVNEQPAILSRGGSGNSLLRNATTAAVAENESTALLGNKHITNGSNGRIHNGNGNGSAKGGGNSFYQSTDYQPSSLVSNNQQPRPARFCMMSSQGDNYSLLPAHYTTAPSWRCTCCDWLEHITIEVQIILFIYIVNKTGQELAVSSMPLLMRQIFNWSDEAVGYYMAVVGSLVLPMNILINSMVKDAEERDTMIKLTYISILGVLSICHVQTLGSYTLFQYILGTTLLFTTLNGIEGVIMSLLSKLISPELAKGTFNSGLLATEAGTLGRVIGDVMITVFGQGSAADLVNKLYVPLGLMVVAALVLTHRYYDKLVD